MPSNSNCSVYGPQDVTKTQKVNEENEEGCFEVISSFVVGKEPLVHDRMEVRREENEEIAELVFVVMNNTTPAAHRFSLCFFTFANNWKLFGAEYELIATIVFAFRR